MHRTADVVVIGAGIIGASIAQQLLTHGVDDVIVVDKGSGSGEGSTGASSAICRTRYTHPEVVRLALHGQEAYGDWSAFTGLDDVRSGLERVGMVWLMGDRRDVVDSEVRKLTSQGVTAERLGPDQLAELFPVLSPCGSPFDLTGAHAHTCRPGEAFLHEPDAGYVEAVGANDDLLDAVRMCGGVVSFKAEATAIVKTGGRATGVRFADGSEISAGLIINAAGPWCNAINESAGIEHRWTLTPTRAQIVHRPWPTAFGRIPVAADASTGIYFRPDLGGQSVLIGSVREEDEQEAVDDPDTFVRSADASFTEMKLAALHHRVPELEARGTVRGIAGVYTVNREDIHPIVGPSGVDRIWLANGFSGHGFKLAPAIGSMVAQAVTGTSLPSDTDVPMSFFAIDRQPIKLPTKHVLA